jgi:hypothetical protein
VRVAKMSKRSQRENRKGLGDRLLNLSDSFGSSVFLAGYQKQVLPA